jgi:hypothetical protein
MILVLHRCRELLRVRPGALIFDYLKKGELSMTTVLLPFPSTRRRLMESRNEELKPRSIHLPAWLWELLDKDAKRCKRSSTKQLEALLTLCYEPEANLEIDKQMVSSAFEATSHRQLKKAG